MDQSAAERRDIKLLGTIKPLYESWEHKVNKVGTATKYQPNWNKVLLLILMALSQLKLIKYNLKKRTAQ